MSRPNWMVVLDQAGVGDDDWAEVDLTGAQLRPFMEWVAAQGWELRITDWNDADSGFGQRCPTLEIYPAGVTDALLAAAREETC